MTAGPGHATRPPATKPGVRFADVAARAVQAWREHDLARSLHAPDRDAVRATDAARALVLELLATPGRDRDLYNACARLGQLLGDGGASPSLAVASLVGASSALEDAGLAVDPARLTAASASLAEGYVAAIVEAERATARRAWEYPACTVQVTSTVVAIVAGYPADDGEALADWSARVALGVSRAGYVQAHVAGSDAARTELQQALSLVGVELASAVEPEGWFASLWKR